MFTTADVLFTHDGVRGMMRHMYATKLNGKLHTSELMGSSCIWGILVKWQMDSRPNPEPDLGQSCL